MYVMMAMSEGKDQGFLIGNDAMSMDMSRAYICVTETGAKAVAEVFINRNPECDEVRVIRIHEVARVTRESAR